MLWTPFWAGGEHRLDRGSGVTVGSMARRIVSAEEGVDVWVGCGFRRRSFGE
jgi:hypothetical protein